MFPFSLISTISPTLSSNIFVGMSKANICSLLLVILVIFIGLCFLLVFTKRRKEDPTPLPPPQTFTHSSSLSETAQLVMAADLEDTTKAAEKCTALNAIAEQLAANDGVAKYLKERPESMW